MVERVSIHRSLQLLDFDVCGSRVFGNERGKLGPDIATQLKDAEWHLFLRRRTERKAEKRAEEAARIEALRA